MNPSENPQRYGTHIQSTVAGETVNAYMPPMLPLEPALDLAGLEPLLEKASQKLGELNDMIAFLPNINLLLYHYIRHEEITTFKPELKNLFPYTYTGTSDILVYFYELGIAY